MTVLQKFFATTALLVVFGVGIYVWINKMSTPSSVSMPVSASPASSTTGTVIGGTGLSLQTPDYKRPIAYSSNIPADLRTQLDTKVKQVQEDLAKNPLHTKAWVDLGTFHKMGGDYENAALYWEFVTSFYTGPSAPYFSLGDLYANYLHDTTKAEDNYLLAIEVNPQNINAYADLYTMYHYALHDEFKAAAILETGLKANPGNNYLLGLQEELK